MGSLIFLIAVVAGGLNLSQGFTDFVIAKIILGPIIGIVLGIMSAPQRKFLDEIFGLLLGEELNFDLGKLFNSSFSLEINIPTSIISTIIIELIFFFPR